MRFHFALGAWADILLANMNPLMLHEFHHGLGARFAEVNGAEIVADYGDALTEHAALRASAGVLDFSFRSRICLTGADRVRFLHGQVTNDVKRLRVSEGCYAALVTTKGKMESDLNIYCLPDELLLDFEPGLAAAVTQRLEKYIVADDVQIMDASPHYGLLSVQGPKSADVIRSLGLFSEIPAQPFDSVKTSAATLGEIYLMNQPRLFLPPPEPGAPASGTARRDILPKHAVPEAGAPFTFGFDLFIPNNSLAAVADKLIAAAKAVGGRACGWQAFETARIEAGIPRFGADMDETNIPLECGIESRAVSYNKGCYLGQEVINRIHSIGHVTCELRGLRLVDNLKSLPVKGDKLFHDGKDVGYITSAVKSPALNSHIALGYVRREVNQIGTELTVRIAHGESPARIVELPFV
jgi:folate-binding protein YgfZ